MQPPVSHINSIRRFNRYYTRKLGVLDETMLSTQFSLTEARILYEIGFRQSATAKELISELGLDGGYLSRTIGKLIEKGYLSKKASEEDGRRHVLTLTDVGSQTFEQLDGISAREIGSMIGELSPNEQLQLVEAMRSVETLLDDKQERQASYILRPPEPGDFGWVVHRHGVLYTQAFGWESSFEALCAEIVARFIRNFDPKKERAWIAERDGERVGSVFMAKHSDTVGQLRLLLVEPTARGLGIGKRLVRECTRFARQCQYEKIMLWTVHILEAAHHIYRSEGYKIVHEEPHTEFGQALTKQMWELEL